MDLKILNETPPWDWPKNADRMLLEILADDQTDAPDRILAMELAGDFTVINDELVDALLSIVRNSKETETLRKRAAISLGPVLEHADTEGFDDPDDVLIAEQTFHRIQKSFLKLYMDADVPKNVRRRILEASVRAPQSWHQGAIRTAYPSDDNDWKLTAVFSMRFVRGFDNQILEALESEDEEIHYQAVCAAGNWEVDAAWSRVAALVTSKDTDKPLLLAAIDAVAGIRPQEAGVILANLTNSDDEDIVEAAYEASAIADGLSSIEFNEDEDDESLH